MIPRTSPPRLSQEPPNYAILDLNADYSVIHASWRKCLLDFRHWCYNNSENRYDYGSTDKRSCEAPGSGHFCIYTTYAEKWMCSIVDGATLYMHGHITKSVGRRRICENKKFDGQTKLIEESVYMEWDGSYIKEPIPVGAIALISSFSPLYKCAEGEKLPLKVLAKAGQVYFVHFSEAARFDSLSLDIIDKDFVAGGIVQISDIERYQDWSSDCKEIRAEIGRPAPQKVEEIEQRAKVQLMIKDIRVMHKLGVQDGAFSLENLPFQLDENGRVQDPLEIGEGGGGGVGGRGAGRERGDRGRGRGRRRGPPGQNSEQQNKDDSNPDFLIERFGNFAKITKFHLEVSDSLNNQMYDLVLTSDPARIFRSSLLQKSCRIRRTPTHLNAIDITPDEDQKLIQPPQTKIQAAFRTEETPQSPPTPHDEMHARMSRFSMMEKGVLKFLNRVETTPMSTVIKKRVPYNQFIQFLYLMVGYCNGNPRVTPRFIRDVCLLAGMLNADLCSPQIEDLMFELCMWRCVDELSTKSDQHHSTRNDPEKHFIELWTRLPQSELFPDCREESNGKTACQRPYLSTKFSWHTRDYSMPQGSSAPSLILTTCNSARSEMN